MAPPTLPMAAPTLPMSSGPRNRINRLRLALATISLALAAAAPRAAALEQQYNITAISSFHLGRLKAIATDSPTSRALRANPRLHDDLFPAYDLFDTLAKAVEKRINESSTEACSLRLDTEWVKSSDKRVRVFQIGEYDDSCLSLLDGAQAVSNGELPRNFVKSTRKTLLDAKRALFDATKKSDIAYPPQNWTDPKAPYILSGFEFGRGGQTCTMEFLFGYRINGRWFLLSSVTNRPPMLVLPNWQRQVTHEYVPRDFQDSLHMVHKRLSDDTFVNATTLVARWSGRAGPGTVDANYVDDEDSALAAALRANEVAIDLASDSVTASNIAILALPMAMSFVPVAFVADLEAVGMLLYVLLTDVFAAIPFLIKGVELVRSSSNARQNVHAFHMGNATMGQMEVWSAECKGEEMFATTGWAFIGVALSVIVIGILLELLAARVIARRRAAARRAGTDMTEGPFGAAVLGSTGKSFMGGVRERERADRFWRDALRKDQQAAAAAAGEPHAHSSAVGQVGSQIRRDGARGTWWRIWRAPARRRAEEQLGSEAAHYDFDEGYHGSSGERKRSSAGGDEASRV